MIGAVFFDVDDTLIDYGAAEREGITAYLAALGVGADRLPVAADFWHEAQECHFTRYLAGEIDFAGQRRARAAAMLTWLGAPDGTDLDAWFAAYRRHYESALRLFDDVAPCLAALRGVPLGVISNNDEAHARLKLRRVGLHDAFACVVCVDTAGCAKPDPAIFRYACRLLNVSPGACAYVGDNHDTDAVGAAAAGLRGIWLDRSGSGTEHDPTTVPSRVTSLVALVPLLGIGAPAAGTSSEGG